MWFKNPFALLFLLTVSLSLALALPAQEQAGRDVSSASSATSSSSDAELASAPASTSSDVSEHGSKRGPITAIKHSVKKVKKAASRFFGRVAHKFSNLKNNVKKIFKDKSSKPQQDKETQVSEEIVARSSPEVPAVQETEQTVAEATFPQIAELNIARRVEDVEESFELLHPIENKLYKVVNGNVVPQNESNPISHEDFVRNLRDPKRPQRNPKGRSTLFDAEGDGNSGFRAIANELYLNSQMWPDVRRQIIVDMLILHYGKGEYKSPEDASDIIRRLYFFDETKEAPKEHWLQDDMLPHVANAFRRPVVLYTQDQPPQTILPIAKRIAHFAANGREPMEVGKRIFYLVHLEDDQIVSSVLTTGGFLPKLSPMSPFFGEENDLRIPIWVRGKLAESDQVVDPEEYYL